MAMSASSSTITTQVGMMMRSSRIPNYPNSRRSATRRKVQVIESVSDQRTEICTNCGNDHDVTLNHNDNYKYNPGWYCNLRRRLKLLTKTAGEMKVDESWEDWRDLIESCEVTPWYDKDWHDEEKQLMRDHPDGAFALVAGAFACSASGFAIAVARLA